MPPIIDQTPVAAHAQCIVFFLHARLHTTAGFVSVQSGFLELFLS